MIINFEIGLKLHTTDVSLITEAKRCKEKGFFDYVELYIIPGTYEVNIDVWKDLNSPYIIHAPHSFHGVNLAQADKCKTNLQYFNEARQFADDLGSDIIIVHGGNNGSFTETIRQMGLLNEKRIGLENKPKIGLQNEICVGWSPDEFYRAADAGILSGTVLDFTHAACAAQSQKVNVMEIIREFMEFHPKVFHLSGGNASSEKDIHLSLGKGSLNIAEFLSVIPEGALVTIETPRDPSRGLEDFVDNIDFLRTLISKRS